MCLGPASCYDPINNVIWNYFNSGAEIARFANEGLAPKYKLSSTLPVTLPEEHHPINAREVVIALLAILARLAVESMPLSTENRFYERPLKEPFCVEVNIKTFSLLLTVLDSCKEKITGNVHGITYNNP